MSNARRDSFLFQALWTISSLIVLTVTGPKLALAQTSDFNSYIPQKIESIGEGWDSILGQPAKKCVQLKAGINRPKWPTALTPVSGRNELVILEDSHAAIRQVTSSVAASYHDTSESASGLMTASSTGDFSSFNSFASLEAEIEFQPAEVDPGDFELTAEAKTILRLPSWPVVFREACGDSFVRGLIPGGHLSIRLSVSSDTNSAQNDARVQLKAASQYASGSAEQTNSLKELTKHSSIKYTYTGSPPQLPSPSSDLKSSIDAWLSYNNYVAQRTTPVVNKVLFGDYFSMILLFKVNDKQSGLETPRWIDGVSRQFDYVRDLLLFKSDLSYMQGNAAQFVHQDSPTLSAAQSKADELIRQSRFWAVNCIQSQGKNCPASPIRLALPSRPGRAEWTNIAVTGTEDVHGGIRKPTLIGKTFERPGFAEIRGEWIFADGGAKREVTSANGSQLKIVNRLTGAVVGVWTAGASSRIPSLTAVTKDCDVYYEVWDDYWKDNQDFPSDPAQGRVGEVVETAGFLNASDIVALTKAQLLLRAH